MKRLLAFVSLVAVTTTAALCAPTPAAKPTAKPTPAHQKAPPIPVAPADEYFGKLKMSVLGIRNTIKDVGANLDIDQTRWTQLASKAAFAEDAMRDWQKKYPQDTWLAKMVFALERMYAKLDSDDGRKRSVTAMTWLVHDFPKSWYGKTGKKELAQGKVGKPPETASANAAPSAAPDQIAAPAAFSSAQPAPFSSAQPAAVSSAQPAPFSSAQPAMSGVNATGSVSPDQPSVSGGSASPAPSPFPSASPSAQHP